MEIELRLVYTQEDMSNAATLTNSFRLSYPILLVGGVHLSGVLPNFFAGRRFRGRPGKQGGV